MIGFALKTMYSTGSISSVQSTPGAMLCCQDQSLLRMFSALGQVFGNKTYNNNRTFKAQTYELIKIDKTAGDLGR